MKAGQQSSISEGEAKPSKPEPIDTGTEKNLQSFKKEAEQILYEPPRITSLSLGEASFEKDGKVWRVQSSYKQARKLTLSGEAEAPTEG
ncbi:MAG: hypothetical protein ABEK50_14645, partial [bacterium]